MLCWCQSGQNIQGFIQRIFCFFCFCQGGPYEKVPCHIRKIFSININVGSQLCPRLKFWPHYVFQFDTPGVDLRGGKKKNCCLTRLHCADPDSFISSTGDDPPADGKILFKKPAKRSPEDKFQGITASSSKKKKKNDGGEKTQDEQKEVKAGKKIKNKSLLSFGGDEEEDED